MSHVLTFLHMQTSHKNKERGKQRDNGWLRWRKYILYYLYGTFWLTLTMWRNAAFSCLPASRAKGVNSTCPSGCHHRWQTKVWINLTAESRRAGKAQTVRVNSLHQSFLSEPLTETARQRDSPSIRSFNFHSSLPRRRPVELESEHRSINRHYRPCHALSTQSQVLICARPEITVKSVTVDSPSPLSLPSSWCLRMQQNN